MAGEKSSSNYFSSLASDLGVDTPLRKSKLISHPDEIKATKISLGRQTHTDLPC
jgi:hypothetical protein